MTTARDEIRSRKSYTLKALGLLASIALGGLAFLFWPAPPEHAAALAPAPKRIQLLDTSRFLGSPDPLPPLVIERAFPKLDFVRPVALTHAGDGSQRLFVCDQVGVVHVFPEDEQIESTEVFLDLREKTRTKHFEEGLLGLAFHPRYKENGEFFIYYSTDPQTSIVARRRVSSDDPNRADPDFEELVLKVDQPFGNHNGGSIEFGPDGYLYVGLGDGGKADDPKGNGQNLGTLLGSILRIDIDQRGENGAGEKLGYAIPPDNPFVGVDGARGEIWAYGIRNCWRLAFDRLTGALWMSDVGQNLFEEVNIIERGGNYGWNVREGFHPFVRRREQLAEATEEQKEIAEQFANPVHEYGREDGKSITGGIVYRGKELPELYGTYLYGDFVSFNIWGLRYGGEDKKSNHLIARSTLPVTAFGETESGEVYVLAFSAKKDVDIRKLGMGQVFNLQQGRIYRFRRRETPTAETADFPRKLSDSGLFADLRTQTPAEGLIPYSINVPLWSDGAEKSRYIALPVLGQVVYHETGPWEFPVGTVLVKTFSLPGPAGTTNRLETRLLVLSERGWDGYTYKWDDDLSDARLIDAAVRVDEPIASRGHGSATQEWYYPSRSDCNACHTEVAGFVLGFETLQLNRTHDYGEGPVNQLDALSLSGIFANPPKRPAAAIKAYPDWHAGTGSLGELARAYLDINCAVCHAPGGTGIAKADLRYGTPLEKAFIIDQEPGQMRILAPGSKVVLPGLPQKSELLQRLLTNGPGRMPTLASSKVDWRAVQILGEWIESLPRNPSPQSR